MSADGIGDFEARRRALDPARSFIVQAPAGSGKTELLIQRYLVLLARVEEPEEIAAITFTRKAASEMRTRVLEALAAARGAPRPDPDEEPQRALTWDLAQRSLARGWRLQDTPARLRIQTIDSLCASLTRQMPVLARFGAPPEMLEDASPLYREAARSTLAALEEERAVAGDVRRLLEHLDNNVALAEGLLVAMLARRDQWLRRARGTPDRAALEAALEFLRREALARLRELIDHPAGFAGTPPRRGGEEHSAGLAGAPRRGGGEEHSAGLAGAPRRGDEKRPADFSGAAARRGGDGVVSELLAVANYAFLNLERPPLFALPGDADAETWQAIAGVLLTKEGEWRRKFETRNGFPAGKSPAEKELAGRWKERALGLVAALAQNDALREALHQTRMLPPPRYADAQWEALGAIARLLPVAAAELKVVFAARGKADFTEIAQGALAALGEADAPTDLALALDYRIRHLLVDEFQDTSISQFELIERLTAGWELGDGRTLFLVGDPMQSIYRFREAEVGLFLKARREGIGPVRPEALTLSANFRSQADIVGWVNDAFERIMPAVEEVATGAVPYTPCEAVHPAEFEAVRVHAFFDDEEAESTQVALLVQSALAEDPDGNVAILVRNRSHLERVVPKLKKAGLRYRAIDIELLGHRPVVQDLLALARALSHPADRLAWLAVLRAPSCGLALADLLALAEGKVELSSGKIEHPGGGAADSNIENDIDTGAGGERGTLWESLRDESCLARLSEDGRARIARLAAVLAADHARRFRDGLRERVEGVWLALGGPACVEDRTDLEDAEMFLDYLGESEEAGEIGDAEAFEEGLARLYALPDLQAEESLQILTVHKAKGLEFDTVIVPGLGRSPRAEEKKLLLWLERPVSQARLLSMERSARSAGGGSAAGAGSQNPLLSEEGSARSAGGGSAAGAGSQNPLLSEEGSARSAGGGSAAGPGSQHPLLSEEGSARSAGGGGAAGARETALLLLAPVKPAGSESDPIYDAILRLDDEKKGHEESRLLYVAATRAKKHLHLLGTASLAARGEDLEPKAPRKGSLLARLWPAVEGDFAEAAASAPVAGETGADGDADERARAAPVADQSLRRLPAGWRLPAAPPPLSWIAPQAPARAVEIEFSWVGETLRHVGSVVHRWLERIAEDGMLGWNRPRIESLRAHFSAQLASRGVSSGELAGATERVVAALAAALEDERGRWLLSPHPGARSELRLAALLEGGPVRLAIDRMFTDEDGRRWIVDYKTSSHEGADAGAFLDRERERYRSQLERYALALAQGETMLGLYFPLVPGWRAWNWPA